MIEVALLKIPRTGQGWQEVANHKNRVLILALGPEMKTDAEGRVGLTNE